MDWYFLPCVNPDGYNFTMMGGDRSGIDIKSYHTFETIQFTYLCHFVGAVKSRFDQIRTKLISVTPKHSATFPAPLYTVYIMMNIKVRPWKELTCHRTKVRAPGSGIAYPKKIIYIVVCRLITFVANDVCRLIALVAYFVCLCSNGITNSSRQTLPLLIRNKSQTCAR